MRIATVVNWILNWLNAECVFTLFIVWYCYFIARSYLYLQLYCLHNSVSLIFYFTWTCVLSDSYSRRFLPLHSWPHDVYVFGLLNKLNWTKPSTFARKDIILKSIVAFRFHISEFSYKMKLHFNLCVAVGFVAEPSPECIQ